MTLKLPFLLKRPQKYHSIKKSKESEAEKDGQKEAEKETEKVKEKEEKKGKKENECSNERSTKKDWKLKNELCALNVWNEGENKSNLSSNSDDNYLAILRCGNVTLPTRFINTELLLGK